MNVLRVGYLVMGAGLAIVKWPEFFDHEPWGLMEGTVKLPGPPATGEVGEDSGLDGRTGQ